MFHSFSRFVLEIKKSLKKINMEFSKNKWVNIGILFLLVMVACVAALLVVTQKEVKDKDGNVIGTRGSIGYKSKLKTKAPGLTT